MRRLDAHQHFWQYSARQYSWIDSPVIRRDFLPADLDGLLNECGIDGTIAVQARQTLEETQWLLELAEENKLIRGVVGWVPLVDDDVRSYLSQVAAHPKLVGVRHVLQAEPSNALMDEPAFNRGIQALAEFGLTYDLLVFSRHLRQVTRFVDGHPRQPFILDHIGKPDIRGGETDGWVGDIRELARRDNVYCKVSGMVTEARPKARTAEDLRPYFETVVEAFGPDRLMFGSDWPVCLTASSYATWTRTVERWTARWSPSERERLWAGTATEVYQVTRNLKP